MNTLKTVGLMTFLTLILVSAGGALGGQSGALMALIFAGVINMGSYWFSDKIVIKMYKGKETTSGVLYDVVRDLCQRNDMIMPGKGSMAARFPLFKASRKGDYSVGLSKDLSGQITVNQDTSELGDFIAKATEVKDDVSYVPIASGDWGMIHLDELQIFFQFVRPDRRVTKAFFAFDEYELDDVTMGVLSRNARVLRETDVTVLLSGHCDERGTIEYNLALGEKRAKAVKDYLVSLGVPANRLQITSYGESKPFAMGSSEAAWAQNRRAHFERP